MARYSEAHNKATQRYIKKAYDSTLFRFPKGYLEETLKPAAARAGESVNAYVQKAIADRIERENAQEASLLSDAVIAFSEAVTRSYKVSFRLRSDSPSDGPGAFSETSSKAVEASSEAGARVAFFDYLVSQMPGWEIVSRDAETLIMGDGEGNEEICEIVSVE